MSKKPSEYIIVNKAHDAKARYWSGNTYAPWRENQIDAERFTLRWAWYTLNAADKTCDHRAYAVKIVKKDKKRYVVKTNKLGPGTDMYVTEYGQPSILQSRAERFTRDGALVEMGKFLESDASDSFTNVRIVKLTKASG